MRTLIVCMLLALLVGCGATDYTEEPWRVAVRAHRARVDSLWGMVGEDSLYTGWVPVDSLSAVMVRFEPPPWERGMCVLTLYYGGVASDITLKDEFAYLTWDVPDSIFYRKTNRRSPIKWSTNCPYNTSWGEYRSRQ